MANYTEVMREFNRLMKKIGKARREEEAQPLLEKAHQHLEQHSGFFPIEHNRHSFIQRALLDTREYIQEFPISYHVIRADNLVRKGHEDDALEHYELALELAQKKQEKKQIDPELQLDRRIRQIDKKIQTLKNREE